MCPKVRLRVKRSASKAAFHQNIIAFYDRLRSKGASRKTAARYAVTVAKSIRACCSPKATKRESDCSGVKRDQKT
jgi:hypothetical protein